MSARCRRKQSVRFVIQKLWEQFHQVAGKAICILPYVAPAVAPKEKHKGHKNIILQDTSAISVHWKYFPSNELI